jgi:hypothetical protein
MAGQSTEHIIGSTSLVNIISGILSSPSADVVKESVYMSLCLHTEFNDVLVLSWLCAVLF